jgi:hypothetical protein
MSAIAATFACQFAFTSGIPNATRVVALLLIYQVGLPQQGAFSFGVKELQFLCVEFEVNGLPYRQV